MIIQVNIITKYNYINEMKRLIVFIRKFAANKSIVQLGRWNIDYCSKKIDNKIDLANEDHCGPCGQYIIDKKQNNNNNNAVKNNHNN